MSLTKRYLEDVVDELAKELNEDWCEVNDAFMLFISNGNPLEKAKMLTKNYFHIRKAEPKVINFNDIDIDATSNIDQINELDGEGGYNYNPDDYDPLALWDQPWWLLSEEEQNKVREQLKNKAKARCTNARM